jgi:hypothetical protein
MLRRTGLGLALAIILLVQPVAGALALANGSLSSGLYNKTPERPSEAGPSKLPPRGYNNTIVITTNYLFSNLTGPSSNFSDSNLSEDASSDVLDPLEGDSHSLEGAGPSKQLLAPSNVTLNSSHSSEEAGPSKQPILASSDVLNTSYSQGEAGPSKQPILASPGETTYCLNETIKIEGPENQTVGIEDPLGRTSYLKLNSTFIPERPIVFGNYTILGTNSTFELVNCEYDPDLHLPESVYLDENPEIEIPLSGFDYASVLVKTPSGEISEIVHHSNFRFSPQEFGRHNITVRGVVGASMQEMKGSFEAEFSKPKQISHDFSNKIRWRKRTPIIPNRPFVEEEGFVSLRTLGNFAEVIYETEPPELSVMRRFNGTHLEVELNASSKLEYENLTLEVPLPKELMPNRTITINSPDNKTISLRCESCASIKDLDVLEGEIGKDIVLSKRFERRYFVFPDGEMEMVNGTLNMTIPTKTTEMTSGNNTFYQKSLTIKSKENLEGRRFVSRLKIPERLQRIRVRSDEGKVLPFRRNGTMLEVDLFTLENMTIIAEGTMPLAIRFGKESYQAPPGTKFKAEVEIESPVDEASQLLLVPAFTKVELLSVRNRKSKEEMVLNSSFDLLNHRDYEMIPSHLRAPADYKTPSFREDFGASENVTFDLTFRMPKRPSTGEFWFYVFSEDKEPLAVDPWWNATWSFRKTVTVSEPGMFERENAPFEVNLTFENGETVNCTKEIRVVDMEGNEIASRIYDSGYNATNCLFANINFPVDVGLSKSRSYYIYFGNPSATEPDYYSPPYDTYKDSCQYSETSSSCVTRYYSRREAGQALDSFNYTNKHLNSDDSMQTHLMNLEYYNINYTQLRVSDNGYIGLLPSSDNDATSTEADFTTNIPPLISPYWVDYDCQGDSGVYRNSYPNRTIFTWQCPKKGGSGNDTVQAVIYESGDIAFRYGASQDTGTQDNSQITGISNSSTYYLYSLDPSNAAADVGNFNNTSFFQFYHGLIPSIASREDKSPTINEANLTGRGAGYNVTVELNVTSDNIIDTILANFTYNGVSYALKELEDSFNGAPSDDIYGANATSFKGGNNTVIVFVNDTLGNGDYYEYDVEVEADLEFNVETKKTIYSLNEDVKLNSSVSNWWDSSWPYRQSMVIDNTQNANSHTNYSVLLTFDSASIISEGRMNSDLSDLRVTDDDNSTLIPYFIERGEDSSSTRVWVKVPSIPASSNKTVYLYYGKPTASSLSDPDDAFEYYINFTRDGVATAGGQDVDSTQYEVQDGGRALYMWGNNWKRTNRQFTVVNDGSKILESYMQVVDTSVEINSMGWGNSGIGASGTNYKFQGTQGWGHTPDQTHTGGGSFEDVYAVLDDFTGTYSGWVWGNDADGGSSNGNVTFRDVRVRPFSLPEPQTSLGEDEETFSSSSTIKNVGEEDVRGYVNARVVSNSTGAWETLSQIYYLNYTSLSPQEMYNITKDWDDAGGWNTDSNPDAVYRVLVNLTNGDATEIVTTTNGTQISFYSEFIIDLSPPSIECFVGEKDVLLTQPADISCEIKDNGDADTVTAQLDKGNFTLSLYSGTLSSGIWKKNSTQQISGNHIFEYGFANDTKGNWNYTTVNTDFDVYNMSVPKDVGMGDNITIWVNASETNTTSLESIIDSGVSNTTVLLYDDGAHGDGGSGDDIYSANYTVWSYGEYTVYLNTTKTGGSSSIVFGTSTTTVHADLEPVLGVSKEFYNAGEYVDLEYSSAGWWDSSWNYRTNITIDNTQNANSHTNYSVLLTLDTSTLIGAGKMSLDGSDIRFTNSTSDEIYHFIESGLNTGSTRIWVNVPSIAASSNETIFMYYGNQDAKSSSDPDLTFDYYVNFTRDGILDFGDTGQDADDTQWEIIYDGRGLHMWGNNWKNTGRSITIPSGGTRILEVNMSSNDTSVEVNTIGFANDQQLPSEGNAYKFYGTQSWGTAPDQLYIGPSGFETVYAIFNDFSGTFSYWVWGNDADGGNNGDTVYKDVRMRKYSSPEPTSYVLEEEEGGQAVIRNRGDYTIFGYLDLEVQENSTGIWENVDFVARSNYTSIGGGEELNLTKIWDENGRWQADGKSGFYRVLANLTDDTGTTLTSESGLLVTANDTFYLNNSVKPTINLCGLNKTTVFSGTFQEIYCNVTDDFRLSEVWTSLEWPNLTTYNYSLSLRNGTLSDGWWNQSFSPDTGGSYRYTFVWANDTGSNLNYGFVNLTFGVNASISNTTVFKDVSFNSTSSRFRINLTAMNRGDEGVVLMVSDFIPNTNVSSPELGDGFLLNYTTLWSSKTQRDSGLENVTGGSVHWWEFEIASGNDTATVTYELEAYNSYPASELFMAGIDPRPIETKPRD